MLVVVLSEQSGDWGIATQNDGLECRVRRVCGKGALDPSLPTCCVSLAVIVDEFEDMEERRENILARHWEGPEAPGAEEDMGTDAIVVAVVAIGDEQDLNEVDMRSWRESMLSDSRREILCFLEPVQLPSSVSAVRDDGVDDSSGAEFSVLNFPKTLAHETFPLIADEIRRRIPGL